MADRPIIFSGAMVRALLAGRKTQTRRLIKPRGKGPSLFDGGWSDSYILDPGNADWRAQDLRYAIGDRLYVRENWRVSPEACEGWRPEDPRGWIDYQAGGSLEVIAPSFEAVDRATFLKGEDHDWDFIPSRYRPCIHMPRWASRLTLLVDDVRVERLQAISEADAIAEGVEHHGGSDGPVAEFAALWESLHGPESWDANPWAVVIEFKTVKGNIDDCAG